MLQRVSPNWRVIERDGPSPAHDIDLLLKKFSHKSCADYLELAQQSARIEFLYSTDAYFRTWSPHDILEMGEAYGIYTYIPDAIPVADNGGDSFICYMTGKRGWGLYQVSFGNIGVDDAVWIAPSLEVLLVLEIGVENLQ